MAMMRAVSVLSFGGPEVLQVKQVAVPNAPADGQVLVQVHAAGVNPVETYIRSGAGAIKPALPYTPGSDGAGIVRAVGGGVTNVKEGSRVFFTATPCMLTQSYAELTLCDAKDVYPLPDNVSFEQGACIGIPAFTAYRALFHKGGAVAGKTVLIHGASGGVGLCCTQMARERGLVVIGTASTEEGQKVVLEAGAHHVFDHKKEGYMSEILKITGGKGVDLIVEMLANVNLDSDCKILASGGCVAVVGNRGRIEIDPRDLMGREASIVGVMKHKASAADVEEATAAILNSLSRGTLKLHVAKEYTLDQAPEAHKEVIEHNITKFGNIILKI